MRNYARVVLAMLLLSPAVCAQTLAAPDPGATLLNIAMEKTDIRATDTAPYRLHAHFRSQNERGKTFEGEYTLLFAAADLWREEIVWPDATSIALAAKGRIWRTGVDAHRVEAIQLNTALHFSLWLAVSNATISPPQARGVDGVAGQCIKLGFLHSFEREVCLDVNGLPLRIKDNDSEFNFKSDEYMPLATKRFPRNIIYSERGRKAVEVRLEELENVQDVPLGEFSVPPGASSVPWCLKETLPRLIQLGIRSEFYFGRNAIGPGFTISDDSILSHLSLAAFHVSVNGSVESMKLYDKKGALISVDAHTKDLQKTLFYPGICGDRVVDAEVTIRFKH